MLAALGALAHATVRVWRFDGSHWLLVAGEPGSASAPAPPRVAQPNVAWLSLGDPLGHYVEIAPHAGQAGADTTRHVVAVVRAQLETHASNTALVGELAARYEETELLYSIGELLGRAHAVDEIASVILREVAAVVGARRAGLRVYDPATRTLTSVATLGTAPGTIPFAVSVDAEDVVVARAFRSGRIETGSQADWVPGDVVAVPIGYAAPGQATQVVGTLALADRAGGGAFTRDETRLIAAVAMQIGAALENARLATLDRDRVRLEHELRVAHDLQVRLMPTPAVLRGDAEVAVRSDAAESVGGDFYTFARLGLGRVGIMLGDVSSHGLAAALIAAEVLAAAGIHANPTTPPDETLGLLRGSLADELANTEMYLSIFYGILDRAAGRLIYSNAGHPHAYRIPRSGAAERLEPTAPPLGLVDTGEFGRRMIRWEFGGDLLVLFTDGLVDQQCETGDRYGIARVLERIERDRACSADEITAGVFADVIAFGGVVADDRTLLVLRM